RTMERAVRVLIAITVPVAVVIALGLEPLLALVFDNLAPETLNLLIWVTRGYLLGLLGQSLQEVAVRAFYARQEPWPVFIGALLNLSVYIGAGWLLYRPLGAVGISVTDALAFTVQAIFLLLLLNRRMVARISLGNVVWKVPAAAVIAGLVVAGVMLLVTPVSPVLASLAAMGAGGLVALVLLRRELVVLVRL
ncbi:MAG TPA: lipid II flippase MurJ, partial [Anaerolineaceae bacterium]|nr:lipid II flippase MurJ [Anaerolineaceae bacterium]